MAKEKLPPLEFDGKFEGYGYFDPRAFWDKVAGVQPDRDRNSLPTPPDRAVPGKDCPPT
jgi:hypothetical protein